MVRRALGLPDFNFGRRHVDDNPLRLLATCLKRQHDVIGLLELWRLALRGICDARESNCRQAEFCNSLHGPSLLKHLFKKYPIP